MSAVSLLMKETSVPGVGGSLGGSFGGLQLSLHEAKSTSIAKKSTFFMLNNFGVNKMLGMKIPVSFLRKHRRKTVKAIFFCCFYTLRAGKCTS